MTVRHLRRETLSWYPFDVPGVEFTPLNATAAGGMTVLTRFRAGTRGSWHTHPGGEELYVLEGRADVSGVEIGTGDFLYTPPGEGHALHALTDVFVLLVLPQQPVYGESPPR